MSDHQHGDPQPLLLLSFSHHEKLLLGLGLKHIPPSKFLNPLSLQCDFVVFSQQLKLRWFFKGAYQATPLFRVPNPHWNPPETYLPLERIINLKNSILSPTKEWTTRKLLLQQQGTPLFNVRL